MSWRSWLLPALAVAIVIFWGARFWRFTADDSYIYYRYAKNVAMGLGPVFNPGERVEGYASPGWVFSLANTIKLGVDPIWASKLRGVVSAAALVAVLFIALWRSGCGPVLSGLACLWLATLPSLHLFAVSGMETTFFALAVAFTTLLPALLRVDRWRAAFLALGLVVVSTARPEGPVIALLISAYWMFLKPPWSVRIALVVAWAILLALLGARYLYYGALLPNAFWAKPIGLLLALQSGDPGEIARKVVGGVFHGFVPALDELGGMALVFLVLASLPRARNSPAVALSVLVSLLGFLVMTYKPSGEILGIRFAVPYAAPLLFLAGMGGCRLVEGLSESGRRGIRTAAVLAALLWCGRSTLVTAEWRQRYDRGDVDPALNAENHVALGAWLETHARPGDKVLCYEAGGIGFGSGLYLIDHEGLITPEIAKWVASAGGYFAVRTGQRPRELTEIVRYCVAQNPDWFLVRSQWKLPLAIGEAPPDVVADDVIQGELLKALHGGMVLAQIFPMNPWKPGSQDKYLVLRRSPSRVPAPG